MEAPYDKRWAASQCNIGSNWLNKRINDAKSTMANNKNKNISFEYKKFTVD